MFAETPDEDEAEIPDQDTGTGLSDTESSDSEAQLEGKTTQTQGWARSSLKVSRTNLALVDKVGSLFWRYCASWESLEVTWKYCTLIFGLF